jgi:hypothetical protein
MVYRKTLNQSKQFEKKITKRGQSSGKGDSSRLNPWLVALFVFVVIGSAILQVISTASSQR